MPTYTPPTQCHSPRKYWTLLKVLEDRGANQTSLAIGRWNDKPCLAIRWNGSDSDPIGNPQSRGLPTWFVLPDHLTDIILQSLPPSDRALARNFIPETATALTFPL